VTQYVRYGRRSAIDSLALVLIEDRIGLGVYLNRSSLYRARVLLDLSKSRDVIGHITSIAHMPFPVGGPIGRLKITRVVYSSSLSRVLEYWRQS